MNKRIGYIDAMRGFTMFLVVYYHVVFYTFGKASSTWSINNVFITFRMPLFFFMSGFLMYKANRFRNWEKLLDFLKKKGQVQLVPTFVFSIVFALIKNISYKSLILDKFKFGYWFTYTLFFYFLIYAIGDFFLGGKVKGKRKLLAGLIISIFIYSFSKYSVIPSCPWFNSPLSNILGFANFQYFLFFFSGALARAHFHILESYMEREQVTTALLVIFVFFQLLLQPPSHRDWFFTNGYHPLFTLCQTFSGFLGIAVVFIFFRKYQNNIMKGSTGKYLQYIGARTLDIYLIHHLIIYTDMRFFGVLLTKHSSFVSELILGGIVSFIIINLCLITSRIIRCSDMLAKLLFGKVIKDS